MIENFIIQANRTSSIIFDRLFSIEEITITVWLIGYLYTAGIGFLYFLDLNKSVQEEIDNFNKLTIKEHNIPDNKVTAKNIPMLVFFVLAVALWPVFLGIYQYRNHNPIEK